MIFRLTLRAQTVAALEQLRVPPGTKQTVSPGRKEHLRGKRARHRGPAALCWTETGNRADRQAGPGALLRDHRVLSLRWLLSQRRRGQSQDTSSPPAGHQAAVCLLLGSPPTERPRQPKCSQPWGTGLASALCPEAQGWGRFLSLLISALPHCPRSGFSGTSSSV